VPSLLERVRHALAPDYEVERELAGGGMGVVYLGRDPVLERPVAIKVLRPEVVTATTAERFLREARILARLSRSDIVPIHHAGDRDGLLYYVMELIRGETLAERLKRGPLPPAEVGALAHDLLSALDAAHQLNVVHRDVKPANVFLVDGRAVLGDFGIARSVAGTDTELTATGQLVGTLAYMAPEQLAGDAVTPRTDLYAAGLVLFEAFTGRRWDRLRPPAADDWRGMPVPMQRAIRQALAPDPADRWPDARAFLAALERRRIGRRVLLGAALGILLIALGSSLPWPIVRRTARSGEPSMEAGSAIVAIGPFETDGAPDARSLADTLVRGLITRLNGHADVTPIQVPADPPTNRRAALQLRGTFETRGGILWLTTSLIGASGASHPGFGGPVSARDWATAADSLADRVEDELWDGTLAKDPFLPLGALPSTREGKLLWRRAERLYARARWTQAEVAYREVEARDSTCLLCSARLVLDIDRWLDRPHDRARLERLRRHRTAFPEHYQLLLAAMDLPWPARGDSLEAAVTRYRGFSLAWYLLGDELFHRGPLFGHARSEAIVPLERAVRLTPGFAPGWGHLAWARIASGDSAASGEALDSLQTTAEGTSGFDLGQRLLLRAGFGWRFGLHSQVDTAVGLALADPALSALPELSSAPRLMPTFEWPAGTVAMGRRFAAMQGRSDFRLSGLLAQLFGYTALGRFDSVRVLADRIRDATSAPAIDLFLAEYGAALTLWRPAPPEERAMARRALERFAAPGAASPEMRRRASWMLAVLARRDGRDAEATALAKQLDDPRDPDGHELFKVLTAQGLAAEQRYRQALEATTGFGVQENAIQHDPFLRLVVRMDRAGWYSRVGNDRAALRELIWSEHQDVTPPNGLPQAGEVDWAFGTMVRWERAAAMERARAETSELCPTLAMLARLWRDGQPVSRIRADSAEAKSHRLGCRAHS
jgi:serine/threonine protein kinase